MVRPYQGGPNWRTITRDRFQNRPDEQLQELERWIRRTKTSQALAMRARIILETTVGKSDMEVADELGTTRATVGKWRRRFLRDGCDGLLDEPRPGAPRTIGDEDVERVVVKTLESLPRDATHWSTRSMAKECGLSAATVSRIWRAFCMKPHRYETFKLSRDPLFIERCAISSACTCIHRSGRWCCAWTRSLRFKPWTACNRCYRCVLGYRNDVRTITGATGPRRCSRL